MSRQNNNEVYDSDKTASPILTEFTNLMRYRDLVRQMTVRAITIRYKRSVLGIAWTMLNPLLTMLVMTVVFSSIFRFEIPYYSVYVLAGLIFWNFFSFVTRQGMADMLASGDLLRRIYIPRTIFVITGALTGVVNLTISLIPMALIMLITHSPVTWAVLVLPLSILIVFVFALGVALLLASSAMFFSDISPIYDVLLVILMYATPIMYPITIIPEAWRWLVNINPLTHLLILFRQPIFEGTLPSWGEFGIAAGIALAVLMIGWVVFTNKADEYAYRA
ncbi:MAG TPA: ABC transporter permease [Longilinea sp.]|nr:ABC transporter permease [Longilinea sp.]